MPHFPVTPAPEFDGKTGNGFWADALAQMDAYTGELVDGINQFAKNGFLAFASRVMKSFAFSVSSRSMMRRSARL